MSRRVLILLCLAFGTPQAWARTNPIGAGLSPDGKVEVAVSAPNASLENDDFAGLYDYFLILRQSHTKKLLFRQRNHWRPSFFSANSSIHALWSSDSHFVALYFEGENHTHLLRVFAVHNHSVAEVIMPDFVRPVFAALNVNMLKSLAIEPLKWADGTLEVSLHGTTDEPREGTGSYDFGYSTILQMMSAGNTFKAGVSPLQDLSPNPGG